MTKNLADELQRTARLAMTGINPLPQGDEPGGLPFRRLLAAAFRARYLLFATTLFGILIGAFLAITTPNSYMSTGKFLFTGSGAESTTLDPTSASKTSAEMIATSAAYILNAGDLLQRVVKKLGPARILQPYQPGNDGNSTGAKAFFHRIQSDWNRTKPEDMTEEEAMKRLRRTLVVERPQYKDVLVATCLANDPDLAQDILATFMKESIEWHIEQYDDVRVYKAAEQSLNDSRKAREVANKALQDFLDRKALVAQFDEEKKRLLALNTDALVRQTKADDDLRSAEAQLKAVREQLDSGVIPNTVMVKKPKLISEGATKNLNDALSTESIKLQQLKNLRLDPNDPDVLAQKKQVDTIRATIAQMVEDSRNEPTSEVPEVNPAWTAARMQLASLQSAVTTLGVQVTLAHETFTDTTKNLKALIDLEPEFVALRDEYNRAVANYNNAEATWVDAQRKRELGIGKYSSLKPFEAASYPLEKEGPNRSKLMIGGFFGGLFLGLALILMRALPDRVVRTRDDLEKLDSLPVIGIMPRLDNSNLRRHVSLREQGW